MASPSAGDTVQTKNSTNSTKTTTRNGENSKLPENGEMLLEHTRKRRCTESFPTKTEIPEKTQRRDEPREGDVLPVSSGSCQDSMANEKIHGKSTKRPRQEDDTVVIANENSQKKCDARSERLRETHDEKESVVAAQNDRDPCRSDSKRKKHEETLEKESPGAVTAMHHQGDGVPSRRLTLGTRDEATRLRKTIQWLEEGARRLREDLASARTDLHEERRAAKIAKRELDAAIRDAKAAEASKYQLIIAELKTRLSRGRRPASSTHTCPSPSAKVEPTKDDNRRREVSALKKRMAEADNVIRTLKWELLRLQESKTSCRSGASCVEARRLETEVRNLRTSNEILEEKLRIALDAEKARTFELRVQHEKHEAELSGLRKSFRSETIRMMDELRGKDREIEKLSKRRHTDASRKCRKTTSRDDFTMRKLRESERNGPIRSILRAEKKFLTGDDHTVDSYIREVGCERALTEDEIERIRELALEQQEVIEILKQALKEKERKLEQLTNKRRKEEFYRQWLELEPVAEVEDEEDHEEGDSALSSAPSSLSPQPGGCGQWQNNGVTREAYEAVLVELEELQSKLFDERQELAHAKTQVRDLEKALLQETRCVARVKDVNALTEKLRDAEEREASLLAELSELREQNELLEFRLLELEETSNRRESPDHTADSGIVSPEPMHLTKDQKQRSRAVATVIPYTTSISVTNSRPISPIPRKAPLSLQESGIFEDEDEEQEGEEEEEEEEEEQEVEHASRGTQTDVPAGELLQEVQRLQELRVRIQERAVKVTTPVCQSNLEEVPRDQVEDQIVHFSSYQERVRELEERLEAYEEAEESRLRERRISKQREEELLDENYRLTERMYWLENELRNIEETPKKSVEDRFTMTDDDELLRDEELDTKKRCRSSDSRDTADGTSTKKTNFLDIVGTNTIATNTESIDALTFTMARGRELLSRTTATQATQTAVAVQTFDCLEFDGDGANNSSRCSQEIKNEDDRARQVHKPLHRVTVTAIQEFTDQTVEEVAKEAKEHDEENEEDVEDVKDEEAAKESLANETPVRDRRQSVSQVHLVPETAEPLGESAAKFAETESEPEKKDYSILGLRRKEGKNLEVELTSDDEPGQRQPRNWPQVKFRPVKFRRPGHRSTEATRNGASRSSRRKSGISVT